jgi:methionine synthase I (cobalamin-dependent)
VRDRIVIYDGAMGTSVQARNPSVDDFWGKEGCNEILVLSRPDIIKDIHASFLSVGCDVVETDTFGATRVVLAEYDLQDKLAEINTAAASPKNDAVRFLGINSSKAISILPNAGLPHNEGGRAVYKVNPAELAQYHKRFVTEYGVNIVGGCCGTTPEHLKAVVDAVANVDPAKREVKPTAAASSAYTSVPLDLDPKPRWSPRK